MKRVLNLAISMILMLAILTGCVNIDYTVKVNKDGSGDITCLYVVKKETLERLEMSAKDFVAEIKKEVVDSEYEIEEYETDTEIGFKTSKHITNVTTDLSLEEAFGELYIKDSEENAITIVDETGKTKYLQNAVIDLSDMGDMSYMGITMKYSVTLPTKVNKENTNGTVSEDGKTVTWDLQLGKVNELRFEATLQNNLLWIICGSSVGVIAITGIVIILVLKKRKNKQSIDEQINDEDNKDLEE